jgi:hypothetical protein
MVLEIIANNRIGQLEDFNAIVQTCKTNIIRCHKLRIYANKQMVKISKIYSQNVGMINHRFRTLSMKIGSLTEDEFFVKHDLLFTH